MKMPGMNQNRTGQRSNWTKAATESGRVGEPWPDSLAEKIKKASPFRNPALMARFALKTLRVHKRSKWGHGTVETPSGEVFMVALPCQHWAAEDGSCRLAWNHQRGCRAWQIAHFPERFDSWDL